MANIQTEVLDRVRMHAFRSPPAQRRQKTNLYLDERVYDKGESLGPKFQNAIVARPSILVFADDDPLANFAHPCRYMLYEAQTGALDREIAARFPPFTHKPPPTLKAFHEGVRFESPASRFHVPPMLRCPTTAAAPEVGDWRASPRPLPKKVDPRNPQ